MGMDPLLAITWKIKNRGKDGAILTGRCPFGHSQSKALDLSAGISENGAYLSCLHPNCDASRSLTERLPERPTAPTKPA